MRRHKVFISYHHARDQQWKDGTVTIVLAGRETWKRKHVDWEIYSSLRHTTRNPRNGLLGIVLPDVPFPWAAPQEARPTTPPRKSYLPHLVPPRLWDNIERGYATMRPWPDTPLELQAWIHEAFRRRKEPPWPDLGRPRFARNRSGDRW